jgi:hypothetical protein
VVYPKCQLLLEVDQSSGHMKYEDDALMPSRLNVSWGGEQPKMRDSQILSQDSLGNQSPRMVEVGEIQKMYFDEESAGPFYQHNPNSNKYDQPYSAMEIAEMQSRSRSNKPVPTMRKGWLNQPKGLKQILWERGLYVNGMNKSQMQHCLSNCPDFKNEKIGIQKLLESRGHILIVSPKCHPELAGSGIEYCWGMADMIFRSIGKKQSTNVEQHIEHVLGNEVLTLERVWKYERRARDYMRLYEKMGENLNNEKPKYHEIEELRKMEKKYRNHRSISRTDGWWLTLT